MAILLKQSTTITIQLGPALDSTDGVTEEVALSPVVQISKDGGAFADRNSATAIAHDQNGWYRVELNTTDTNTLGRLTVKFNDQATHLPVWEPYMVVPANVFDALILGSDKLEIDVLELGGVAQSLTDLKDFADDGYDPAVNKVEGVKLVDTTTVNTDIAAIATEARLAELDSANLPADIDSLNTTKLTTARADNLDNLDATITSRGTSANQTTILNRLGDYAGTGLNTIKGFMQALFRKDGGVSGVNLPSEINEIENSVTGNYNAVTDSQEGVRDVVALNSVATEARLAELDPANLPSDIDLLNSVVTEARLAKLDSIGIPKNIDFPNFEFFMRDVNNINIGKESLSVTALRRIDGTGFVATVNSPSESGNGLYKINFDAADLNGDIITFKFSAPGAFDTIVTFITQ